MPELVTLAVAVHFFIPYPHEVSLFENQICKQKNFFTVTKSY